MNQKGTINRERVRLNNHSPQSRTTVHGKAAALFGIPFAGVGIFIIMISLGKVDVDPSSIHAPLWVLGVAGWVFAAAGLFLIFHGFDGMRRETERKRGMEQYPRQPWMWDHPWDPAGYTDDKLTPILSHMGGLLFMGIFLSIFNWWAFFSDDGGLFIVMIVGLFDLILIAIFGNLIYKIIQFVKHGKSRLRFGQFPFHLGETVSAAIENLPQGIDTLKLNLRCVEERYETSGSGDNRSQRVVSYQVYGEERMLKAPSEIANVGRKMKWDLPGEAELATRLSERPAWFWELEAEGEISGVDFKALYLLPVYAKS